MSQQAIANAIYARLSDTVSTNSIWSHLSGRIHHIQAPPDSALPLLVFRIHMDRPQGYFDGSDDIDVELQLDLWGAAADGAAALAAVNAKIMGLLHRQTLAIDGYVDGECCAVDRGRTSVDDGTIRITSRWRVRAAAV